MTLWILSFWLGVFLRYLDSDVALKSKMQLRFKVMHEPQLYSGDMNWGFVQALRSAEDSALELVLVKRANLYLQRKADQQKAEACARMEAVPSELAASKARTDLLQEELEACFEHEPLAAPVCWLFCPQPGSTC